MKNNKETPLPLIPLRTAPQCWWAGYCPNCKERIHFAFSLNTPLGERKHYCLHCGQLCDFSATTVPKSSTGN